MPWLISQVHVYVENFSLDDLYVHPYDLYDYDLLNFNFKRSA